MNATIRRILEGYTGAHRPYHTPLPPLLEEWHCYTTDGGHSIVVLLSAYLDQAWRAESANELSNLLVPAPVKSVLRSYFDQTLLGVTYVVTNLPYDQTYGLVTPPDDDEY